MNIHPDLLKIITKDLICPNCDGAFDMGNYYGDYFCNMCLYEVTTDYRISPFTLNKLIYKYSEKTICFYFNLGITTIQDYNGKNAYTITCMPNKFSAGSIAKFVNMAKTFQ